MKAAPVVGRGEHCDALAAVRHLVALLFHLVAAHNVAQAVLVAEALRHVRPELAADAALRWRAPCNESFIQYTYSTAPVLLLHMYIESLVIG